MDIDLSSDSDCRGRNKCKYGVDPTDGKRPEGAGVRSRELAPLTREQSVDFGDGH